MGKRFSLCLGISSNYVVDDSTSAFGPGLLFYDTKEAVAISLDDVESNNPGLILEGDNEV